MKLGKELFLTVATTVDKRATGLELGGGHLNEGQARSPGVSPVRIQSSKPGRPGESCRNFVINRRAGLGLIFLRLRNST